jgi:ribose transport system ATP-binding protein
VAPTATPAAAAAPLLEIRRLRKVYGGTVALADVDLTICAGEIHALLGENGAGKSTLVRILAAVDHEDGGSIALAGERLPSRRTPRAMSERGVAFIHQDLGLVGSMTVAENIAQYVGYATGRLGIRWSETRRQAQAALARLDVDLDPDLPIAELSIAEQAMVAIVRALALDAQLIVLDEPTASLAASEADRLLATLETLRASGVGCVVVTHRIDEVLAHCDRVTVLRNGSLVETRHTRGLSSRSLIEMIVGHPAAAVAGTRPPRGGRPRLVLDDFEGPGFGPVSMQVAPGEVVAVTGFADAGHLKLVDALYGAWPTRDGSVELDGAPYRPARPAHAIAQGIQQVPSDRAAMGLAPTLSARENLFLNPRGRLPIDSRQERRAAAQLMADFDVRPRVCDAQVSVFSGGNAQKLLLARTLAATPRLLLLCEPTAGVDVGARSAIYAKVRRACDDGMAVVLASSDFQEVAEVANRAVVLRRGRISRVLDGDDLTVATLTGAAYGD